MQLYPENIYHLYNRGNNQEQVFFTPANYVYFLRKLRAATTGSVDILAWCLMPNHFHLLVYVPPDPEQRPSDFNRRLAPVLSSYAQAINHQQGRTGSLFQVRTKAKRITQPVGDSLPYALTCLHYLHQNPLRAGLVRELAAWPWSSYLDYAGLRAGTLCNQALARELLALPATPAAFRVEAAQALDPQKIRAYLTTP